MVRQHFQGERDRLEEGFRRRYGARSALATALARFSPAFAFQNAVIRLAGTGLDRQRRFGKAFARHREIDMQWYRQATDLYLLQRVHPAKYGEPAWDVSDRPRFIYRESWPEEEVRPAFLDLGILAAWALLFFAGACVGMVRYDVR